MAQQNKPDAKALDELKAQIPQMSRKKLGALLLERVKENDVDSVQAILDTVEMSDKKPSGMFDRSLKGTLHPDMLNNALCKAAGSGRNEVIPVLLARGADPRTRAPTSRARFMMSR